MQHVHKILCMYTSIYILCVMYYTYILDIGIIIDMEQNQQNDEKYER